MARMAKKLCVTLMHVTQPQVEDVWGKKSRIHMRLLVQERRLLVPSSTARVSVARSVSSQDAQKSCVSLSTLSAQQAQLRVWKEQRMVPGTLGWMLLMAL